MSWAGPFSAAGLGASAAFQLVALSKRPSVRGPQFPYWENGNNKWQEAGSGVHLLLSAIPSPLIGFVMSPCLHLYFLICKVGVRMVLSRVVVMIQEEMTHIEQPAWGLACSKCSANMN